MSAAGSAMFTRLGYSLIILIVAAAAAAVAIVAFIAWPGSDGPAHTLDVQQVVNYSRFNVIESIEQDGDTLTVRFKKDFDTKKHFGTSAHEFTSTLPQGADIVSMLTAAGVPINGADGVQVTAH